MTSQRLERDRERKGVHVVHILDHLLVATSSLLRGVGVDVGKLGPGDGHHGGDTVELHGAGTEGDHGVVEGEILGLELVEVTSHEVLGVVVVEDGVVEDLAGSLEGVGDGVGGSGVEVAHVLLDVEDGEEVLEVVGGIGFVEGHGDVGAIDVSEEDVVLLSLLDDGVGARNLDDDGIEVGVLTGLVAGLGHGEIEGAYE